jgi:hypothetical protein
MQSYVHYIQFRVDIIIKTSYSYRLIIYFLQVYNLQAAAMVSSFRTESRSSCTQAAWDDSAALQLHCLFCGGKARLQGH